MGFRELRNTEIQSERKERCNVVGPKKGHPKIGVTPLVIFFIYKKPNNTDFLFSGFLGREGGGVASWHTSSGRGKESLTCLKLET